MRTVTFRVLLMSLWVGAFFTGCEDDGVTKVNIDDDAISAYAFWHNGTAYSIDKGFIENHGLVADSTCADYDVILSSANIDHVGGAYYGSGNLIYLDLNSPTDSLLSEGSYAFDGRYYSDSTAVREPYTCVKARVLLNYVAGTEVHGYARSTGSTSDGEVTITHHANKYKVVFSFTLSDSTFVSGSYTGALESVSSLKSANMEQDNKW